MTAQLAFNIGSLLMKKKKKAVSIKAELGLPL